MLSCLIEGNFGLTAMNARGLFDTGSSRTYQKLGSRGRKVQSVVGMCVGAALNTSRPFLFTRVITAHPDRTSGLCLTCDPLTGETTSLRQRQLGVLRAHHVGQSDKPHAGRRIPCPYLFNSHIYVRIPGYPTSRQPSADGGHSPVSMSRANILDCARKRRAQQPWP